MQHVRWGGLLLEGQWMGFEGLGVALHGRAHRWSPEEAEGLFLEPVLNGPECCASYALEAYGSGDYTDGLGVEHDAD